MQTLDQPSNLPFIDDRAETVVSPVQPTLGPPAAPPDEPAAAPAATVDPSVESAGSSLASACLSRLPLIGSLQPRQRSELTALAEQFGAATSSTLAARPGGDWLVKGVFPANALVLLSGAPGVGKSFITLDLALRLVHGMKWHGKRTLAGSVLYVAAEGSIGVGKRLRAWHQYHGLAFNGAGLLVTDRAVSLTSDHAEELGNLVQLHAQAARLQPRLVVIDTLAPCSSGADENSARDMGKLIEAAKALRRAGNCTVLLVHHVGKDASRGPRGSTALLGAVDTSILVARHQGLLRFQLDKQKEEEAAIVTARLQLVPLGTDQDGDPMTSCVAVEVEHEADRPSPTAQTRLTDVDRRGRRTPSEG